MIHTKYRIKLIKYFLLLVIIGTLLFRVVVSLYTNVLQVSMLTILTESLWITLSPEFSLSDGLVATNRENSANLERLIAICNKFQYKRACYNAGVWNFRLNQFNVATRLFCRAYEKNTTDKLLVFYLGASQWAGGDKISALDTWHKAQDIDKYFAIRGDVFLKRQMPQEALEAWQISDTIDDTLSIHKTTMYVTLCEFSVEQGERLDALRWCEKAVNTNSSWPVHYAVVQSLLEMGEFDRAFQVAQTLVQREAELTFAGRNQSHRLLAQVYVAQSNHVRAIEQYKLIEQPDQFVLYELSQVYLEVNLVSDAVSTLQEVVRIDPTTNVAIQAQNQLDSVLSR